MPSQSQPGTRAAVVHDFFVNDRGGERVAIELAGLLWSATVYTSFFDAHRFGSRLDPARVRTWGLQRLLGPTAHFRRFLPLYPVYFSALDLRRYDLVVSSSVAFSKAVRTSAHALHVSYVHTPMRYAWDLDAYLAGTSVSTVGRVGAATLRPLLQRWDRATARRPDHVVCNSLAVRDRIRRLWNRDADVIHPPVDTDEVTLSHTDDGYLLIAARLLAYRRVDLAVSAATSLGRQLVVAGDGPERRRLEAMAGPSVRFVGDLPRAELVELFRRCHAYLVPGIEDFGIAPVEAMAAGKPVVAYRGGGALETVIEGETGTFFDRPDPRDLADAIQRLERYPFDAARIRAHAQAFDSRVFRERWRELLARFGVNPAVYGDDERGASRVR